MILTDSYAEVNRIRLHYTAAGSGKLILFLHGFPDFWYIWRKQLAFFGQRYYAVALDLRGYNLSAKPANLEEYALPVLVQDIVELIQYFDLETAIVVGHDWGGMLAWELASACPHLLEKLVILNAPHPAIFRRELASNPAQQAASSYIPRLQSPQAEVALSANDFAALKELVLTPGLQQGYFDTEDQAAYLAAWAQPGALTAALNYYRAADFLSGMALPSPEVLGKYRVHVPTLVIWGAADTVLLPSNLDGLELYVPDLRIERIPDAGHALIHEKPAMINLLIERFLTHSPQSPE